MSSHAEICLDSLWPTLEALIDKAAKGKERTILIGIGGQGGAGKSTVSTWMRKKLSRSEVLPLDDYRLPRSQRAHRGLLGSHPDGNDRKRLLRDLKAATENRSFRRPVFCPAAGRADHSEPVPPQRYLICDGEIAAHQGIREQFDLFLLVDCHWRTQLNARLSRDISERAYNLEKAIEVFLKSNLRDYPLYSKGAAEFASMILYRNSRGGFTVKKPLPHSRQP
tara:strand:+ start:3600 stop:4268 length:669 start_codon:yes stop_codon:yes gene_type:complete